MDTLDITDLLRGARNAENYYVFNPSILSLSDTWMLVAYRICHYDLPVQLPPWKVWTDGYKYFPDREQIRAYKYRDETTFGGAYSVPFEMPILPTELPEFDSTGLALLEIDPTTGALSIAANNVALFSKEMNQDARLTRMPTGEIRITYNVFHSNGKCSIRWRTLSARMNEWMYELSDEYLMFEPRQKVEKNCVFLSEDHIVYAIGDSISYLRQNKLETRLCPMFQWDGVYISSSTPPIAYRDGHQLAVGHIKVRYDSDLLESFFSITEQKEIERHSTYIYFMFFYELNEEGKMTRVSSPFIPTQFMNHLPHLLVMPTGLCESPQDPHRIFVSYGEGDCRCKLLSLSRMNIENILRPSWCGTTFFYLTKRLRIQHVGYYGAGNTGDECFRYVFQYLAEKYYPHATINFSCPPNYAHTGADITILGGGDVITHYFLRDLPEKHVIAVGAGIPYTEFESSLTRFDKVFLRDKLDAAKLGASYYPDLGFLLPKALHALHLGLPNEPRRPYLVGISVMRTYFHPLFPRLYQEYLETMTAIISALISEGFQVELFPFGISVLKPSENDMITCMEIRSRLNYPEDVQIVKCNPDRQVEEMYARVSRLDFMICARYHSHIFATLHNVPFMSLTLSRKCIRYMHIAKLEENLFRLKANELDLPIHMDSAAILNFFRAQYWMKEVARAKLQALNKDYETQMALFEKEYVQSIVDFGQKNERTIFYPPVLRTPTVRMPVEEAIEPSS